MGKVPPLREFRKPNTFGAIPKNVEREIEPTFEFIAQDNSEEKNNKLSAGSDDFDAVAVSNQLATSSQFNKQPVSNQLATTLATSSQFNKQPVSNQSEESGKLHKQPVSNHISNQSEGLISNQLATTLATRKIWKFKRIVHENLTYLQTMDLVARLCGNKLKVLTLICKCCAAKLSTSSGPITTEMLRNAISGNSDTANTVVERLITQGFIWRDKNAPGKRGTGGFSCFCTTTYIRDAVIELRPVSNQLATTLATSNLPELATSKQPHKQPVALCSSSLLAGAGSKTTTTAEIKLELPDDWKKIDCAPIRELGEAFGEGHLLRLFQSGKTNPNKVQESINRIVFAVKYKTQTIKKTPTAMLMGLLSDGREFDPPKGYYLNAQSEQVTPIESNEPESTQEEKLAAEQAKTIIKNLGKSLFGEMPKN